MPKTENEHIQSMSQKQNNEMYSDIQPSLLLTDVKNHNVLLVP